MQKVVGSNPISRLPDSFAPSAGSLRGVSCPEAVARLALGSAPWRSGYAAACKAVYTGSIPVGASPRNPHCGGDSLPPAAAADPAGGIKLSINSESRGPGAQGGMTSRVRTLCLLRNAGGFEGFLTVEVFMDPHDLLASKREYHRVGRGFQVDTSRVRAARQTYERDHEIAPRIEDAIDFPTQVRKRSAQDVNHARTSSCPRCTEYSGSDCTGTHSISGCRLTIAESRLVWSSRSPKYSVARRTAPRSPPTSPTPTARRLRGRRLAPGNSRRASDLPILEW